MKTSTSDKYASSTQLTIPADSVLVELVRVASSKGREALYAMMDDSYKYLSLIAQSGNEKGSRRQALCFGII